MKFIFYIFYIDIYFHILRNIPSRETSHIISVKIHELIIRILKEITFISIGKDVEGENIVGVSICMYFLNIDVHSMLVSTKNCGFFSM